MGQVSDLIAADDMAGIARYFAKRAIGRSTGYLSAEEQAALRSLPKPTNVLLLKALIVEEGILARWNWYLSRVIGEVAGRLPAKLADEDAEHLLAYAAAAPFTLPATRVVALVEWQRARGELSPEVLELVRVRSRESQRVRQLAVEILGPDVRPGDPWADEILAELPSLDAAWGRLLAHAGTAVAAKPTGAWNSTAGSMLDGVDREKAEQIIARWLDTATRATTRQPDPVNADLLRGLLWMLPLTPVRLETVRTLGALTEAMLRRLPEIGPVCPKLANAAVGTLARLDGEPALAQLARLSTRVTYKGTLNEIDKALDARAAALGLGRDEVEELAVPAYGLTEVGRRTVPFEGCRAEVTVSGTAALVTWYAESGKVVKSPPAAVRRDHPDAVAELKGAVKELSGMLSAQSERLDRLFLSRRTWTGAAWRERYLDHPVVGTLARRLIWLVDGVPCGYADAAVRTVDDAEVALTDGATVELWHPIGRPVAEVVAWREWLERHGVVQPFKQAHREVYLLTPAEEETSVYSNRFAAHILRQHQFHALALARGWRDKLRLMVDDTYPPPSRALPAWGLRAEYWVEGIGETYGTDTTESGSYLRVATDQVRFYPIDAAANWGHASGGGYTTDGDTRPVPLAEVPPLVLSEVMRDVDLFVGVASVGNDPTWADGGPEGRHRDYWTAYSFGELSATAETRRDLLARLLPRLAVGKRARIDGRFLVVQGDLRSYRIHLGSGNILMSPGDTYLCIVPDRGFGKGEEQVRLPFEGDRMLALILSKAMLLAKDSAITDPTITRQLTG